MKRTGLLEKGVWQRFSIVYLFVHFDKHVLWLRNSLLRSFPYGSRYIPKYTFKTIFTTIPWLIGFCQENTLVIANNLFQQHKRRLYTRTSPDGQHRNQIDYVLCSQRWRNSIQSIKTRPGADCAPLNFLSEKSLINWCPNQKPICRFGKLPKPKHPKWQYLTPFSLQGLRVFLRANFISQI